MSGALAVWWVTTVWWKKLSTERTRPNGDRATANWGSQNYNDIKRKVVFMHPPTSCIPGMPKSNF